MTAKNGTRAACTLRADEMERYRELLRHRLAEITGDIDTLEAQAIGGPDGERQRVPQDVGDQASEIAAEDVLRTVGNAEREEVREILAALQRLEEGSFGVCERTGRSIPKARLDVIPWTRYTTEAAREVEAENGFLR